MVEKVSVHLGLASVQERITLAMQKAKRTDDIRLVAISKLQSFQAMADVIRAGQIDFGENYVQEAHAKQDALTKEFGDKLNWHFTGHIQSRKAKDVVGRFGLIHTLDSEKLTLLLDQHAKKLGISQAVLIQVNVGAETQKSGIAIKDLPKLAEMVVRCDNLNLQGLMCLPPVFDAGMEARPHFELLRKLRDDLNYEFGLNMPHLSMGMSGDLEAAIWAGSTLVRVGTDIFGLRDTK